MKEKGFTLIELLAVIVILAIIALIATPIVLNIIKDSKNSSLERSAELYLDQVKNEIARYNMIHPGSNFNPSECIVQSDDTLNCDGTSLTVEISGDKSSAGSKIFLSNGSITGLQDFKISGKILKYSDGKITQSSVICNRVTSSKVGNVPQGKYKAGDEYTCKVNDTTSYNFYILNTNGNKVNMIMDRNICSDGTAATSSNTCYVLWATESDYKAAGGTGTWVNNLYVGRNDKGPVTAFKYLNEATSSWSNIPNLNEDYKYYIGNYKYSTIKFTGKARLILLSDIDFNDDMGMTMEMYNNTHFLLNNLKHYSGVSGTNNISNIFGYWAMNSYEHERHSAIAIFSNGNVGYEPVSYSRLGVRPVITLDKSNLQ